MNKKNILYLSYDGLTDQLSQSQIIPYLDILSNLYSVTVLSCEKKHKYKDYLIINKQLQNKNIKSKKVFFTKNRYLLILSKIIDLIKILLVSAKIIKKNNISIVHCRGHIPAFIVVILKFIFKIQLIFDYRGMWVEERIDMNSINLTSIKGKTTYYLLKKLELKSVKSSSKIIVLTHSMKNYIINQFNYNKDNIFVIPCYVNNKIFNNNFNKYFNLRKELNLSNECKILCYLGSVSGMYLVEDMLDFFVNLKKKDQDYFFLFISNNLNEIKKICNKKKYHKFKKFIKVISLKYEQIPMYLSQINVSICFLKNSIARTGTFPIKFAEILSMGIPQIYNSNIGDFDTIFKNNSIGSIIKLQDKLQIIKLINNFTTVENLNKNKIKKYALENFSIIRAKDQYVDVYRDMK